jgi:hypothetical protein
MIGIPLAIASFAYGEWAAHRYLLHGYGREKASVFAFHFHTHHQKVRGTAATIRTSTARCGARRRSSRAVLHANGTAVRPPKNLGWRDVLRRKRAP